MLDESVSRGGIENQQNKQERPDKAVEPHDKKGMPYEKAFKFAQDLMRELKGEKAAQVEPSPWSKAAEQLQPPVTPDISLTYRRAREMSRQVRNKLQTLYTYISLEVHRRVFAEAQQFFLKRASTEHVRDPDRQERNVSTEGFEAYLAASPESLAFGTNFSLLLEGDNDPSKHNAIDRAAALVTAVGPLRDEIKNEEWQPEVDSRGHQLEMRGYNRIFSRRQPEKNADSIKSTIDSDHVLVGVRGGFYKLDLKHPDGTYLNQYEIRAALLDMANDRYEEGNEGPGTLTALPRREWASIKKKLLKRGNNKEAFQAFDTALMTISLDLAAAPRDKSEAISLVQYGAMKHSGRETFTSTNRSFEGPSIVVAGDTTAGLNCEHYGGDGSEYMFFAKKLEEKAQAVHFDSKNVDTTGIESAFTALSFDIPEADLKRGLQNYNEIVANQSMQIVEIPIKNASEYPDAVVQLAVHLTKFIVKGKSTFSIVPVSVRHRRNGRIGYASPNTSKIEHYVDRHKRLHDTSGDSISPTMSDERAAKLVKGAIDSMKNMVKEVKGGTAPLSHITALAAAMSGRSLMEQLRGERTDAGLRSRAWWLKKQEGFFTAVDPGLYYMIRGDVTTNGGAQKGVEAFSTIASKAKDGMSIGFTSHDNKIVFSMRLNGESQKLSGDYASILPQALELVHKDYLRSQTLKPE